MFIIIICKPPRLHVRMRNMLNRYPTYCLLFCFFVVVDFHSIFYLGLSRSVDEMIIGFFVGVFPVFFFFFFISFVSFHSISAVDLPWPSYFGILTPEGERGARSISWASVDGGRHRCRRHCRSCCIAQNPRLRVFRFG